MSNWLKHKLSSVNARIKGIAGQEDDYSSLCSNLDYGVIHQHILPVVRQRFGYRTEITSIDTHRLARRIILCEIRFRRSKRSLVENWTAIAKVDVDKQKIIGEYEQLKELWAKEFSNSARDGISVPEPLVVAPELKAYFMEKIPRKTVLELLNETENDGADYIRKMAQALTKLHAQPIGAVPIFTPVADRIQIRQRKTKDLVRAYPALKNSIDQIVKYLFEVENTFSRDIYKIVHGDYHLSQVHIEGSRCWILDLESSKIGDPAWDVSVVLSKLKKNFRELQEVFLQEYFSGMDKSIAARLPLYEAYHEFHRATKLRFEPRPAVAKRIEKLICNSALCIDLSRKN